MGSILPRAPGYSSGSFALECARDELAARLLHADGEVRGHHLADPGLDLGAEGLEDISGNGSSRPMGRPTKVIRHARRGSLRAKEAEANPAALANATILSKKAKPFPRKRSQECCR